MLGVLGIAGSATFLAVVVRPAWGAYLLLFTTPLTAGFARGSIPLRPNEAILLLVLGAIGVRTLLLMLSRRYIPPRFDRMDVALLLLAGASSVLPLLWLIARDQSPSQDDLLYAVVLIKYYILFRLFRSSIVTTTQVMTCLWVSMASAAIEAMVAILQVLDLFGVPALLYAYYDQPFSGTFAPITDRGTSTLASAFCHADLMIMNLIIALTLDHERRDHSWLLLSAAVLFLAGCMASGEFSGYIGLIVALLALGSLSARSLRQLAPSMIGVGAVMAIPLWPVLAARFSGLLGQDRIPTSWNGRWQNLQHFFLPKLMEHGSWLLGVQPAPRLATREVWRAYVYVESGYVWLIWVGGVPLLLAFIYFVTTAFSTLRQIAQTRRDPVGAAATAGYCYVVTLVVLTLFDAHITMRGTADLLYPLIAMSLVRQPATMRGWRQASSVHWRSAPYPATAGGDLVATTD